MHNQKTRLTAIAGTTMALVIAGTAAVSAAGPRDDDRGFGPGKGRAGVEAHWDTMAMPRMQGLGDLSGGLEGFERRETTIQTADGTTSHRVEQGIVDSATDASLGFALGSGEAVTVTIDEDTTIIALEALTVTRRGWSRERMAPTQIEVADIEVGTEILVWSDSEDGGDFVASRIIVQPAPEANADEVAQDEAAVEEAPAEDSEAAAATDA